MPRGIIDDAFEWFFLRRKAEKRADLTNEKQLLLNTAVTVKLFNCIVLKVTVHDLRYPTIAVIWKRFTLRIQRLLHQNENIVIRDLPSEYSRTFDNNNFLIFVIKIKITI